MRRIPRAPTTPTGGGSVTSDPFARVVIPIASVDDARKTARAVGHRIAGAKGTGIFVSVVEKAGGAPDKASVEQREQWAEEAFEVVRNEIDDSVAIETAIHYGTDVAATIVRTAHQYDANAIAFTPRGGSRWVKLLTGDVTNSLVATSDLPVVVLPDTETDGCPSDSS